MNVNYLQICCNFFLIKLQTDHMSDVINEKEILDEKSE